MTEEQAVRNIVEVLSSICPIERIGDYHKGAIVELVRHFKKLSELEHYTYLLSPNESVRVDILNNIVEQIQKDIVEDEHSFLWKDDQPKDDFERGVLNVIRLIQHRVHCICD